MIVLALLASVAAANETPPVLAIGAGAPDFKLPGIDGKEWTLGDFKDAKVLCVIFTCNHCPDAYAARGRMQEIHEAYRDKGVALVAINGNNPIGLRPDELGYSPYGDSFEEMKPFAGENPDDLAEAIDPEWTGAQPHSVILSPEGGIVWRHTGRVEPVELRRQVLKALDAAE